MKASFYIPKTNNVPLNMRGCICHFTKWQIHPFISKWTIRGFRRKISMKLFYQLMAILVNFALTSSHLHPLEVKNCGSNSRLVVDKDGWRWQCRVRLERVISPHAALRQHFTSLKTDLVSLQIKGFRRKISMKLFYQLQANIVIARIVTTSMKLFYQLIAIFVNFSPTSNHLHPLRKQFAACSGWRWQ